MAAKFLSAKFLFMLSDFGINKITALVDFLCALLSGPCHYFSKKAKSTKFLYRFRFCLPEIEFLLWPIPYILFHETMSKMSSFELQYPSALLIIQIDLMITSLKKLRWAVNFCYRRSNMGFLGIINPTYISITILQN